MLILSRKSEEAVVVRDVQGVEPVLRVTVLGVCNGRVKLGFEAGADVAIHRAEVWERIQAENKLDPESIVPAPRCMGHYLD